MYPWTTTPVRLPPIAFAIVVGVAAWLLPAPPALEQGPSPGGSGPQDRRPPDGGGDVGQARSEVERAREQLRIAEERLREAQQRSEGPRSRVEGGQPGGGDRHEQGGQRDGGPRRALVIIV